MNMGNTLFSKRSLLYFLLNLRLQNGANANYVLETNEYRKNYAFPLVKSVEWVEDHFGLGLT